MELQSRAEELTKANTKMFAISYDPVPLLAYFAGQHGITYSLLSDAGSAVITRLGLLNLHVAEQQAYAGRSVEPHHTGIPYPGTFLLNEQGVIMDKRFEQTHQPRPAPDLILEEVIGADLLPRAVSASAEGIAVRVTAWLAAATYRPMQRLHVHFTIQVAADLRLYGAPTPQGFTPFEVELTGPEGVTAEPIVLPPPKPFRVEGIDQPFLVYEGRISASLPLQITSNLGATPLTIGVRYQTCSETVCYPPEALKMELSLQGLDNLRPEPRD